VGDESASASNGGENPAFSFPNRPSGILFFFFFTVLFFTHFKRGTSLISKVLLFIKKKTAALTFKHSIILLVAQGISNSLYGIQRMTSDCEDVRMLVQALAAKIELSWKVSREQRTKKAPNSYPAVSI
jgi:hypothetical protein